MSPGAEGARSEDLRKQGLKVEILVRPEAPTLYAALREADLRGVDAVVVVGPSEEGLGLAVADRLGEVSDEGRRLGLGAPDVNRPPGRRRWT